MRIDFIFPYLKTKKRDEAPEPESLYAEKTGMKAEEAETPVWSYSGA